jgi:hypothetical protein
MAKIGLVPVTFVAFFLIIFDTLLDYHVKFGNDSREMQAFYTLTSNCYILNS